MKQIVWDTLKVFFIFLTCTILFYAGLRVMHTEYEQYHRYDPPEGQSVKVSGHENSLLDRFNLFFRLGE